MTEVVHEVFTLHRGSTPLLISLPHVGTWLPEALRARLVPRTAALEDTDWHLDRLYAFARGLGAGMLVPRASRWLVDLNRPRENTPMYAGQNNTELVPTRFFSGDALYRDGELPGADEIAERVRRWWQPYHDALAGELARLRAEHGHAVLFDAHSIRSELPWLFEGRLPQMNLGTAGGASCSPVLEHRLGAVLAAQQRFSFVINGRFKGGQITRAWGRPADRIHAVQLEMAWSAYMEEAAPYAWDDARAAAVTPLLQALVLTMIGFVPGADGR